MTCQNGHVDCLKFLAKNGAALTTPDDAGVTPCINIVFFSKNLNPEFQFPMNNTSQNRRLWRAFHKLIHRLVTTRVRSSNKDL